MFIFSFIYRKILPVASHIFKVLSDFSVIIFVLNWRFCRNFTVFRGKCKSQFLAQAFKHYGAKVLSSF